MEAYKKNIQIYGDRYQLADGEGVFITNVDISQVLNEFDTDDVLDALDFDKIAEYYAKEWDKV